MVERGIKFHLTSPRSPLLLWVARKSYSAQHRIRLYRKLAKLMRNGKQLLASMENLHYRAARKSQTDIEAIVLGDILHEMRGGKGFAIAMGDYASTNECMILDSGGRGGTLPDAMDLSATMLDAQKQMKSQVLSAIVQPLFLLAMLLVVVLAMSKVVIPKLTVVLEPSEWDPVAYGLYQLTQVVNSPWFLLVLFLLVSALVGVALSLPLWSGRGRATFDKIPPWSMFRLLIGSGWVLSLASLIRSGETILNSMKNMRDVATRGRFKNLWLRDRLNKTIFHYTSGYNVGEALEATGTGFPDQEIVDDLVTFADLDGFDDILYNIGQEWISTGLQRIKQQTSVLNTASMVFIGIVLAWFTYAVVSIQMSLGSYFSGMGGI